MCGKSQERINSDITLIVPKLQAVKQPLSASEGGVLTMRVTSQDSGSSGLMRESYLGSVQQKYRCAPLIQNVTDEEEGGGGRFTSTRTSLGLLWKHFAKLLITLNVPSMLREFVQVSLSVDRDVFIFGLAFPTRALGHFTHSSSSRQADADARAAGWSIVHLDIVRLCLLLGVFVLTHHIQVRGRVNACTWM